MAASVDARRSAHGRVPRGALPGAACHGVHRLAGHATRDEPPSAVVAVRHARVRHPALDAAKAADRRADAKFAEALRNNRRGDDYTSLAVAFASVLFFAATSERMKSRRNQWTLLGLSLAAFAGAMMLVLVLPKRF
ncbi:MAG: hypothetical protein U0V73_00740 [Acidimicrobiia bacterium]